MEPENTPHGHEAQKQPETPPPTTEPDPPEAIPETKEYWEVKKLKAEVNLLEEQLRTEQKPRKREDIFKDWLTTITTILGIGGGVWGLFYGIFTYADYKQKEEVRIREERRFQYNEKMVAHVNSMDTLVDQSVMILKYFGKDAIPILLYRLERIDTNTCENIINAILEIEKDAYTRDPAEAAVIRSKIFHDLCVRFRCCRKENPGTAEIDPLLNYIALVNKVSFVPDSIHNVMQTEIDRINPKVVRSGLMKHIEYKIGK